jgi:hypothetical protein
MKRRDFVLGSLAGLVFAPQPAHAAQWERLGERRVNLLADFDTIPVGAGDGVFSHIRMEVFGNDIFVGSMRVVFANGNRVELPVRSLIRERTRTRNIPLPGMIRAIRRIELSYARGLKKGNAYVVVWGRRITSLR